MDPEASKETDKDYVVLGKQQRTQWRSFTLHLLMILYSEPFKVIYLIAIYANYILASTGYIFFIHRMPKQIYYTILVFDITYVVKYVVAVVIYFWKSVRINLNVQPRNKWILIVDLFLFIPFSYLYEGLTGRSYGDKVFLFLRGVVVLRLIHPLLYCREKMKRAGANHISGFLIQCALFLMLLQQTFACAMFIMAWKYSIEDVKQRWTTIAELRKRFHEPLEHYVICLCHVLFSISQRTFGIIVPLKYAEKILIIVMTTCGFTFTTGIFIGVLSFLFEKAFQRRAVLRQQMGSVQNYLQTLQVPESSKKLIRNYYKILWEKKDGVHQIPDYPELPFSVMSEIAVDINIGPLQRSTIFRDKPEAFLRSVSSLMKHEFYQTNELIYHAETVKDKMIFVISGVVSVLSDEDNESYIISFGPGTCLGEASLILTLSAKSTVQAVAYTELQVLHRKDFGTLIDLFPEIYTNIQRTIMQRIENTRQKIFLEQRTVSMNIQAHIIESESKATIRILKEKLRKHLYQTEEDKTYLSMYTLEDNIVDVEMEKIFMTSTFPLIIRPFTALHKAWTTLNITVASFIAIFYPYFVVFLRNYTPVLLTVFEYIDIILILDFFVIMHTAITEKNNTITSFKLLLRKRVTRIGFYLDFLSCIKFESLCAPFATENPRICEVLRLNRLLKAYRIPKLMNVVDMSLKSHVLALRLSKYLLYILISIYWFGAFLFLVTCFDIACTEDGWYLTKLKKDIIKGLVFSFSRKPLLTSIYYSLHFVTSPSFSDVFPNNILDLMLGYFGTLLGLFILGYCVADLTATITRRRNLVTKYQEKLFALIRFLKEKNMPKDIINRVENFFVVQWEYDRGTSMNGSLFYNANYNIQTMVQLAEKWDIMVNLPVFRGRDYDFLQQLVMESTPIILPPGEIIHYKNEINTILYIIQDGYCIREDVEETELQGPTSYFGSISIFSRANSITTVRAMTNVKMLCIQYSTLWKCASMFPMIAKQLQDTLDSLDLTEEMEKAKELHSIPVEYETDDFTGSIINVLRYCRRHGENYGEPFLHLSYMRWIQFILLPICILPDGFFIKAWLAMRLIVASMVALLTPYTLVQFPYAPVQLETLLWIFDIVAYIDLYVMMFVGFYGPKGQLIIHPLKTAEYYLKGKFLIDLTFCFPWDYIAVAWDRHIEMEHHHSSVTLFRIMRIFQIYRLPQFFNYLSNDIRRGSNILQIAKFLPTIIITINFCAAILIHNTCKYLSKADFTPEMMLDNDTNVQPPGYMKHPMMDYGMFCKTQSWIDRSIFQNLTDPFKVYIVAIYFCSSTITTCGFGDITPQYPNCLILTISMIVVGFLFFGYIYAKISSHKADWRTLQLEQQTIVLELKRFMVSENVNKVLRHQIMERLEYRWKRTRGAEVNEILRNLNDPLHEDAVMSMYEQILTEVPIFKNVERSFFRVVGKLIRESYYLKQQIIYETDDIITNMCIIYRGTVKITRGDNTPDLYMGRGGIFGNISPAARHKILVTVTAMTKTDLIVLDSRTFFSLLDKHPAVKTQIESSITNPNYLTPDMQSVHDIQILQDITDRDDTKLDNLKANCWKFFQIVTCWKLFRTTIPPTSIICKMIDLTCLGLAYFNCIFATYEFSFRHHTQALIIKSVLIDLIFLVRLLLNLHKSYEDDFGEPVVSNRLILKRYFRGKKLRRSVDIISNIPFYYITLALPLNDSFLYFSSFRLITMCRFLHFIDYYEEKSDHLFANTALLKLATIMIWVSMIVHIFACGWYLCACPLGTCRKDAWTSVYLKGDEDKNDIYVSCIYFMSGLFTTASNGDIVPRTLSEQIYVTVVMILANFLIGIFIGDIMNSLNSATLARVRYEQGIQYLQLYLRNCNVSDFQMEKLTNYVRKLWEISDGNQTPRALAQLQFKSLHELMTDIYGRHIKNAYVFKDVEKSFIRQLASFLKRNLYFPGDYIVKHGNSDQSMYFIHSGEIDILTVHPNLTETVHEVLRAGEMFGIIQGLYSGIAHHFSYRARTTVHTVSLCLSDWEHLLNFFPSSKAAIYRNTETVLF